MDIELLGWIGEDMSDEEIIAMIDEIEPIAHGVE